MTNKKRRHKAATRVRKLTGMPLPVAARFVREFRRNPASLAGLDIEGFRTELLVVDRPGISDCCPRCDEDQRVFNAKVRVSSGDRVVILHQVDFAWEG